MATSIVLGHTAWRMQRDSEGHREYRVTHKVRADPTDGPYNVLSTAGLPLPGSVWFFRGDVDIWAWCKWDAQVIPLKEDDGPTRLWSVEQTFSTKLPEICRTSQTTNPLLEPQTISGNWESTNKEIAFDRFGRAIRTSSHELIRGPIVEFEDPTILIKISQNVPLLQLEMLNLMQGTVNMYPLWGVGPRLIRLKSVSWERKFQGNCGVYYTRNFEFAVKRDGWDRDIWDEGTLVLNGHWDPISGLWVLDDINGQTPDHTNPTHFKKAIDREGNTRKLALDGVGKPWVPAGATRIYDCLQCPGGTYKYWQVSGLDEAITLEHTEGCTWTGFYGAGGTELATLTRAEGLWTLETTSYPAGWELSATRWSCTGPNTMSIEDPALDDHWVVTLTGGSSPVAIHVEAYNESDFLLLGIPLVF